MVYSKGKININSNECMIELLARPIQMNNDIYELSLFISENPSLKTKPDGKNLKLLQLKKNSK